MSEEQQHDEVGKTDGARIDERKSGEKRPARALKRLAPQPGMTWSHQ